MRRIPGMLLSMLLGGTLMSASEAKTPRTPLDGQWGGRQVRLMADASGTHIELDCAELHIKGPVWLDAAKHFSATASYLAYGAGPQRADGTQKPVPAEVSGKITGDELALHIHPRGQKAAADYSLRLGARTKIIRCY